jgi:hypothetical protein
MALDSCSSNLLPQRHGECTLDLATVTKISGEEAMKSCLAAEMHPGEVSPATESRPEPSPETSPKDSLINLV